MNMLKCCLNPKVIAGVAVVGAGLVLFAPNLVAGGLPLLIGLICPLSMLVMMGAMGKMRMGGTQAPTQGAATSAASTVAEEPETTPVSREARLGLLRAQLQVLGEQQAALAAHINELSAEPTGKALEESEKIVEAAGRRS